LIFGKVVLFFSLKNETQEPQPKNPRSEEKNATIQLQNNCNTVKQLYLVTLKIRAASEQRQHRMGYLGSERAHLSSKA
jgi:hypothetical protein